MLLIPRFKKLVKLQVYTSDYKRLLSMFQLITPTLTAQLYNLGFCQKGPVVAMGLVCGNALLNTSMQQDGFDSIVSGIYGISCVAYSTMTLITSVIFIDIDKLSHDDIGYYLIAWAWINLIFFIRCVHFNRLFQAIFFLAISVGSILEVISNLFSLKLNQLANYIILCSLIFPTIDMSVGLILNKDVPVKKENDSNDSSIDIVTEMSHVPGMPFFDTF